MDLSAHPIHTCQPLPALPRSRIFTHENPAINILSPKLIPPHKPQHHLIRLRYRYYIEWVELSYDLVLYFGGHGGEVCHLGLTGAGKPLQLASE